MERCKQRKQVKQKSAFKLPLIFKFFVGLTK